MSEPSNTTATRYRWPCLIGLAVVGQSAVAATPPIELQATQVDGQAEGTASPAQPASVKYTADLLDTPQTVTIVPHQVIEQQNLLSMRDILSTVPGITFSAGEGGGGYGDSINLRGFSASNDITVDGIRDSAQYSRTDAYNLQQVEVINGANSVYSGVGSVGGTVNLVSKAHTLTDFNRLSVGVGTDNYKRTTADINHTLSDTAAFRLNLMAHGNDVPGRDYEDYNRWGIAPSLALGLGTPTRLTISYEHQQDRNTPEYGIPFFQGSTLPGVKRSNYYGYNNMDEQDIRSDALTLKVEHDLNDSVTLSNLSRYSEVDQKSVVNPPAGTWCLSNGLTPTGVRCSSPGTLTPSGARGTERDTINTLLFNQTDLNLRFATGALQHNVVTGVALTQERYDLDAGNAQRNANGSTVIYPPMSISDPDSEYVGPQNYVLASHSDGELHNAALYAFDTVQLNEHWELNGGARVERNEDTSRTSTYATNGNRLTQVTVKNDDNLFSWRLGLVYKPVDIGSIYVAYSNSKTPSDASVNGSCVDSLTSANNCSVAPETAKMVEVGTKWELLDRKLALTASLFRNERENYKVASGDPLVSEQTLDGTARVDGLTLGLTGLITQRWSVFANYTQLRSEVLQGVSDLTASTSGDPQKGNPLPFTPRNAFNLWTTYDVLRSLQVGYGITAQSDQRVSSNDADANIRVAGYTTHRAMLDYKFTRDLDMQLNVDNLFNKEYYTRVRGGTNTTVGWATPGAARSATVALNYRF